MCGGQLATVENHENARSRANNQRPVPAEPLPPGWKHQLYGRQDARRYGARSGCALRCDGDGWKRKPRITVR